MEGDAELRLFATAAVAEDEPQANLADMRFAAVAADARVGAALALLARCPPLDTARVHVSTVLSDTWVPALAGVSVAELAAAWGGAHAVGLPPAATKPLVAAAMQRALLGGALDALLRASVDRASGDSGTEAEVAAAAAAPLFAAVEAGIAEEATLGTAVAAALRCAVAHYDATRPTGSLLLLPAAGRPPRTSLEARVYVYFGHTDVDAAVAAADAGGDQFDRADDAAAAADDDDFRRWRTTKRNQLLLAAAAAGGHLGVVQALWERIAAPSEGVVEAAARAHACVTAAVEGAHADVLEWALARMPPLVGSVFMLRHAVVNDAVACAARAVERGLLHPDLSDTAVRAAGVFQLVRQRVATLWYTVVDDAVARAVQSARTLVFLRGRLQPQLRWPTNLVRLCGADTDASSVAAMVRPFAADEPTRVGVLAAALAATGHVAALAELAALGGLPRTAAMTKAAAVPGSHSRTTLAWLRGLEPPCPWDEDVLAAAAGAADEATVAWMLEAGCPASAAAVAAAAAANRVPVLALLRFAGVPWDERACSAAARAGAVKALLWLCTQSPPAPWDADDVATRLSFASSPNMAADIVAHLHELRAAAAAAAAAAAPEPAPA